MTAILDECPFPTRETLDRLSAVDRIRAWRTWLGTYPDAPAADRSTAGRIIEHATKSYDLSDEDRRILRAEAQPARHGRGADGAARQASPAPAPANTPPARQPAKTPQTTRPVQRSPEDATAGSPFSFDRPVVAPKVEKPPAAPEPEETRKIPIHISANMVHVMAGISNGDGRGGVNAAANCVANLPGSAPDVKIVPFAAVPAGMVRQLKFEEELKIDGPQFNRFVRKHIEDPSKGIPPHSLADDRGNLYWTRAVVNATLAKFGK